MCELRSLNLDSAEAPNYRFKKSLSDVDFARKSLTHLDKVAEIHAAVFVRRLHEAEKMVGECVSRPLEVFEESSDFDRPCRRNKRAQTKRKSPVPAVSSTR